MAIQVHVSVNPSNDPPVTCVPDPVPVPRAAASSAATEIQWNIPTGYTYDSLDIQQASIISDPVGSANGNTVTASDDNAPRNYPYTLTVKDNQGNTYSTAASMHGGDGGPTIRNN